MTVDPNQTPADPSKTVESPAAKPKESIEERFMDGYRSLLKFLSEEPGSPLVEVAPGHYMISKLVRSEDISDS